MSEIVQIIVAVLGLAGAFETYSGVALIWKLVALAVSGLLLINLAATALARWANPTQPPGFAEAPPKRNYGRVVAGALGLAVIAVASAAAAWAIVYFYGIEVVETSSSSDALDVRIRGAVPVTAHLLVLLPSSGQSKCRPQDLSHDPDERAQVTFLSPDSASPQLDVTGFRYPQLIGVVCSPRVGLSSVTLRSDPPDVEVFRADRASQYHYVIILVGGALWLVGIGLLLRPLR